MHPRDPSLPPQCAKTRAHWGPRLTLTRSSLGLGQDDRVLVAWLRLASRKRSTRLAAKPDVAAPPALEFIFPLTDALHAAKEMGTAYKKVGNAKKLSYTPVLQSGSKEGNEKRIV